MCHCRGCKFRSCPLLSLAPHQILRRRFPVRCSGTHCQIFLARHLPRTFRCLPTVSTYRRSLSLVYPCRSIAAEITLWNRGAQVVALLFDLDAAHLCRCPHLQANCSDLQKTLLECLLSGGICRFRLRGAAMPRLCAAKRHSEQVYSAEICASFIFGCLTLRRLMSYIYIYIYVWSTHS